MSTIQPEKVQRALLLIKHLTTSKARKTTVSSSPQIELIEGQTQNTGGSIVSRAIVNLFRSTTQVSLPQPTQEYIQTSSGLSLVQASNELVKLLASNDVDFSALSGIEQWRILRAGMIATVYGRGVDAEARKQFRNRFMYFTRHDDLPVNRKQNPFGSKVALEEVLWCFDHMYDLYSNFSHFHLATQKPEPGKPSMLEAFLGHVTGQSSYKTYSPSQTTITDGRGKRKGTTDDFPGPGFVINGLGKRAKLFPARFIENAYPQLSGRKLSPRQVVENEYRKVIIESERYLGETQFTLFRGLVIIRNPQRMKIDNKNYALIVFNDHFPVDNQEIGYLIPDDLAAKFTEDPLMYLNTSTRFHPANLLSRFGHEIIVPTYETTLGGFDKAFPYGDDAPDFYPDSKHYDKSGHLHRFDLCYPERTLGTSETYDTKGYIHRTHDFAFIEGHDRYWSSKYDSRNYAPDKLAHNEVRNSLFFAQAQLDLLKAAFRLYNFGYEYSPRHKHWTRDEFRLLKNAIAFRHSARFPQKEKPVLVGTVQGRNSGFSRDNLRDVGILDTNLMLWQRSTTTNNKSGIDTSMLPGKMPDDTYDLRDARTWRYFEGGNETDNWLEFQATAYAKSTEPVFYYGHNDFREQLRTVMKGKEE